MRRAGPSVQLAVICSLVAGHALPQQEPQNWLRRWQQLDHLRAGFVGTLVGRLEVETHGDAELSMAYYDPRSNREDRSSRVRLYAPYYVASTSSEVVLYDPLELPTDSLEYAANALLLAFIDLELYSRGGDIATQLAERSRTLYGEGEQALGLYVTAAADFGSYLLALANELERAHLRGTPLCRQLRQEVGLFRSWRQAFERMEFVGSLDREGKRQYAGTSLERLDKELLMEWLFDGAWSGDPDVDFSSRYCGSEE